MRTKKKSHTRRLHNIFLCVVFLLAWSVAHFPSHHSILHPFHKFSLSFLSRWTKILSAKLLLLCRGLKSYVIFFPFPFCERFSLTFKRMWKKTFTIHSAKKSFIFNILRWNKYSRYFVAWARGKVRIFWEDGRLMT